MLLRIGFLVGLLGILATSAAGEDSPPAPDGAGIFRRSCVMCHGADGRAATPMGKRMGVRDLTAADLTDERVRTAVLNGIKTPKGAMPALRGRLSDPELDSLVAHVRSLRPAEKPAN
jgi:mono/diheme cytochrome c family protein